MADTIKDFLVGLGFKVDTGSQRKFTDAIRSATLQAELLGRALEGAAKAIAKAVADISAGFEQIYYTAQRANTSVASMKAMTYALSQLGTSAQSAQASLSNFGRKVATDPGAESLLGALGIRTRDAQGKLRDTSKMFEEFGKATQKMPSYVALGYAQMLGIDEDTMRAMREQPALLARLREEQAAYAKEIGLNQDEAAKKGQEFMQSLRRLQLIISLVAEKILSDLAPALKEFVDKITDWVRLHPDEIRDGIVAIGEAAVAFAKALIAIVTALAPVIKGIGELAGSITGHGGVQGVMEAFAAFMVGTWALKIVAAIGSVSSAWGALLLALGIVAGLNASSSLARNGVAGTDPATGGASERSTASLEGNEGWARPYLRRGMNGLRRLFGGSARAEGDGGSSRDDPDFSGQSRGRTMAGATFREKAPKVMAQLMKDFNLSRQEAAVILGNLGHESAGFTAFKEGGNGPGRGWAQWTDPGRKRRFFKFASDNKLDPKSDEANYGFLKWELENTHKSSIAALKAAPTAEQKMIEFEKRFEGAGIKGYGSRYRYMREADRAFGAARAPDAGAAARELGRVPPASFGVNGPAPLQSSTDNSRSATLTQSNTFHVHGGDSRQTADMVLGGQRQAGKFGLAGIQSAIR